VNGSTVGTASDSSDSGPTRTAEPRQVNVPWRLGATTTVGSDALSLASLTSLSVSTDTSLVYVPGVSATTSIVSVEDPPGSRSRSVVQVTVRPDCGAQVQPSPPWPVAVKPSGSVSVTVMVPVAASGPTLVTSMRYVPVSPATKSPSCETSTFRSGSGVGATTFVGSASVLLSGLESPAVSTYALVSNDPGCAGTTSSVSDFDCPGSIRASV
jgi:hypothetical protein